MVLLPTIYYYEWLAVIFFSRLYTLRDKQLMTPLSRYNSSLFLHVGNNDNYAFWSIVDKEKEENG